MRKPFVPSRIERSRVGGKSAAPVGAQPASPSAAKSTGRRRGNQASYFRSSRRRAGPLRRFGHIVFSLVRGPHKRRAPSVAKAVGKRALSPYAGRLALGERSLRTPRRRSPRAVLTAAERPHCNHPLYLFRAEPERHRPHHPGQRYHVIELRDHAGDAQPVPYIARPQVDDQDPGAGLGPLGEQCLTKASPEKVRFSRAREIPTMA